jgi:hypothetical protein
METKSYRARSRTLPQATHCLCRPTFALILTSSILAELKASLVLETETAQLGKQGERLFSAALQFERDKDGGTAIFTLNQFGYAFAEYSRR